MSRVFFTSDTHFLHDFVAGTRNFASAEPHDEAVIDAINNTVNKRDTLWILGDLGMGSLGDTLAQVAKLNGTKRLIFGNHDAGHPMHDRSANQQKRYLDVFDSVHLAESVKIRGQKFSLSHFPYVGDHYDGDRYTKWRLRESETPLLCGHVHHQWDTSIGDTLWQMNVGIDSRMTPFSSDEVFERWEASK